MRLCDQTAHYGSGGSIPLGNKRAKRIEPLSVSPQERCATLAPDGRALRKVRVSRTFAGEGRRAIDKA